MLVAVSGGADSTALLVGLGHIAAEFDLAVSAAHLHHGLRGREADRDQCFVRELCTRLEVPLATARWNTRVRMHRLGLTGQAGLRTLRRSFLSAVARRVGAVAVATGHTADDQLETVLLRLLRGTGLPGLAGMRPYLGHWIKPMLEASRFAVEADLRDAGLEWCEDSSNLDLGYARNRVRHLTIPALLAARGATIEPARAHSGLACRVARTAAEVREGLSALDAWARSALRRARRIQSGQIELDLAAMRAYPGAVRRTLLRHLWRRTSPEGPGLTHHHLDSLERLLSTGRGGAVIELPGAWRAECSRGSVGIVGPRIKRSETAIRVAVPGRATGPGFSIRGRWTSGARALVSLSRKLSTEEYFAAEELEGALEVRAGRADDRFVPFGRKRSARLDVFLRSQGVPREMRSRPRVLADARGILWVIGVRRSDRAPVTAMTRRALWVHVERNV